MQDIDIIRKLRTYSHNLGIYPSVQWDMRFTLDGRVQRGRKRAVTERQRERSKAGKKGTQRERNKEGGRAEKERSKAGRKVTERERK